MTYGGAAGYPPLHTIRRRIEPLLRKRGINNIGSFLSAVPAVVKRQSSDNDVCSLRDVAAVWQALPQYRRDWWNGWCHGRRSFVYVMSHREYCGLLKIGISYDPESRARAISMSCGIECQIEGAMEVCCREHAAVIERLLHSQFSKRRQLGEWFTFSEVELRRLGQFVAGAVFHPPDSRRSVSKAKQWEGYFDNLDLLLDEVERALRVGAWAA